MSAEQLYDLVCGNYVGCQFRRVCCAGLDIVKDDDGEHIQLVLKLGPMDDSLVYTIRIIPEDDEATAESLLADLDEDIAELLRSHNR